MAITELLSSVLASGLLSIPGTLAQSNLPGTEISLDAPARKGWVIYTVQPGDTLSEIASRFRVDPKAIMYSSGLEGINLKQGQTLRIPIVDQQITADGRIPPGVRVYKSRSGDTVEAVAARFDLTVLGLVSANPGLKSLDRLEPGTSLFIPTDQPGLIVKLAHGETIKDLAGRFGLSVTEVAKANGLASPTDIAEGDLLLLPGVQAKTTYSRLLKIREVEKKAAEAEAKRQADERRQREEQRQKEEQARQQQLEQQKLADSRRRQQTQQAQTSQPRLRRANAIVAAAGYRWPVSNFVITTYFGSRGAYQRFHTGVDLAAPYGTPIYAARAGQVEVSGWSRVGYGFHVILDHGRSVETLYGHMSRIAVRGGQWVERGQLIGYVGSTGWSTGPHCHFEVRVGGSARNPLAYLP